MSESPQPLHTLNCPTCGAPLEIKINEPTIRCQYCNASIKNPDYRPPQPAQPAVHVRVERQSYAAPRRPTPLPAQAKFACLPLAGTMIAISVIVVVIIAIIGARTVSTISDSLPSAVLNVFPPQIQGAGLMVNTDGGTYNIITPVYDISANNYALASVNISGKKELWRTLAQKDYLRFDAMVAGDTYLYVSQDTRLIALQISDGKQVWEASLPDSISTSCTHCLLVQKGQVVALTDDYSLGAYDAQTGHQTWEKHFESVGRQLFLAPDGIVLLYSLKRGSALGLFDATNGEEITHIEPACSGGNMSDELENYSDIILDTSKTPAKVYIFFGLFNACVQRWDLSNGNMDWQNVEEGQNLDNSRDYPALLADGKLIYLENKQLHTLDAETGTQPNTIGEADDSYSVFPLLVQGQRLIVRAMRERGTTQFELWGYDLATGKNLWKHPIIKSAPLDPPNEKSGLIDEDESGWTYRLTQSGLWLITFQTRPNQVNVAQINLDTGELSKQKNISLEVDTGGDDSYMVPERINSSDNLAWYTVFNRVYAIDPEATAFPYRWP